MLTCVYTNVWSSPRYKKYPINIAIKEALTAQTDSAHKYLFVEMSVVV